MYTIYGALGSPYSLKVRAVMRYRRLPHIWVHGHAATSGALQQVRAPVIPVVQYPDGSFHNDSTPLIYDLEARHPERSVIPDDPAHAFLAHLIEDFADEWLTKAMFGYRWLEDVDQIQMSRWLAFDAMKGGGLETSQNFAEMFRARQVGRMAIVGCTRENFPLIEATTRDLLGALEAHLLEVVRLEDVQHLQGRDALGVGRQLPHVVAAIVGRHRLDPIAAMLGKVEQEAEEAVLAVAILRQNDVSSRSVLPTS